MIHDRIVLDIKTGNVKKGCYLELFLQENRPRTVRYFLDACILYKCNPGIVMLLRYMSSYGLRDDLLKTVSYLLSHPGYLDVFTELGSDAMVIKKITYVLPEYIKELFRLGVEPMYIYGPDETMKEIIKFGYIPPGTYLEDHVSCYDERHTERLIGMSGDVRLIKISRSPWANKKVYHASTFADIKLISE